MSPDVATCADCLREMKDPADRRFGYPFTNCTNCGPRFTIVEAVPYDRKNTTMRHFTLCADCAREYGDPNDRRYHAEPNACAACAPQVTLARPSGEPLAEREAAIERARALPAEGRILAVKGLGGFHLACDATSERAVAELRRRKGRPFKLFAIMCRDLATARLHCEVGDAEARELRNARRPILLLRRRAGPPPGVAPIAEAVAPRLDDLGVMLPYTPLHSLLTAEGGLASLVMTSGNRSGPSRYRTVRRSGSSPGSRTTSSSTIA